MKPPSVRSLPASRLALTLALAAVLSLIVAELTLRTWAHFLRVPYETFDVARGTPALVPGTHSTPFGTIAIDELGFVARAPTEPVGRLDESRPVFRILAIGDSCTFGAADAETTFPAILERLLRQNGHNAFDYQVVNGGIAGLNSDEAIGRLGYALEVLRPDLVTIYLGWNDLMKLPPRSQTSSVPLSSLWRKVDQLWLSRGLRKLFFYYLRARLKSPRAGANGESGRFARFRPSYFEANLRTLISKSREMGAQPILVTLPHPLRRDLQPIDLVDRHIQFPYFYSGNALGDFMDLIASYNETIRRVGREAGVPVADVAARFDRVTEPSAYFLDTMHPTTRGNALIAEYLERALREQGLLVPPSPSEPGGRAG